MFKSLEEEVNKCIREGSVDLGISSFSESSWRPFDGDGDIENDELDNSLVTIFHFDVATRKSF